jgi:hypothetical protein
MRKKTIISKSLVDDIETYTEAAGQALGKFLEAKYFSLTPSTSERLNKSNGHRRYHIRYIMEAKEFKPLTCLKEMLARVDLLNFFPNVMGDVRGYCKCKPIFFESLEAERDKCHAFEYFRGESVLFRSTIVDLGPYKKGYGVMFEASLVGRG